MFIDKRYLRYFDWSSFMLIIALLTIGLIFVFSSTYSPQKPFSIYFKKQLFGAISGLFIYLFFSIKDLKIIYRLSFLFYFLILGIMVYTILKGFMVMGAKRWISLYFFRFQPSELIKLFLPPFMAFSIFDLSTSKISTKKSSNQKNFLFPGIMLLISVILTLKQPDLGSAIIILLSGLTMLRIAGIGNKFFLILGLISIFGAPVIWKSLHQYQKKRILVLIGKGSTQERYQIEQSKIAIGSGGLVGKGFLKGTQNKLAFLPEDHTDFIFSVICEEIGFVGALFILLLFCGLFTRLMFIILQTKSIFDQTIGIGLLSHIMISTIINIGMTVGLLPTVGIPLPLFSYGITHLWVTLASLGWINNIAMRRFNHY